jgi:hypothetical protein
MSFWLIGDEEPEDPRFVDAGPGACGLYFLAGAACMRQVRYRPENEVPLEWIVSDRWVRGWPNGVRLANRLVKVGLWVRVQGGYRYGWIQTRNKADAVREKRAVERRKWEAKQARKRAEADLPRLPTPLGSYTGELESQPAQLKTRSRRSGDSRGTR